MTEPNPPISSKPIESKTVADDYANQVPPKTAESGHSYVLFWGCFIALITTAFGFITRMFLLNEWAGIYGLDPAQLGRLQGIGIWPFAVSIILFSLFIDRIGYKVAMYIAFLGYLTWVGMATAAYNTVGTNKELSFQLLYWGSLILGLSNGTVEAFINPLVATMFSHNKTKWLNILHAGWPGGLVLAGLLLIGLAESGMTIPWIYKIQLIAIPTVIFGIMLTPLKFPVSERVASGVSYRRMLQEFGFLGAAVVGFLITLQLLDFFQPQDATTKYIFIGLGVAMVLAFTAYTQTLGSPLMFFMILIMMPLATTELGTDGWITSIMEEVAKGKFNPGWVLVYTSAIMMVLRFFAGPIVHKISPLGLLAACSILAIIGLYTLSFTQGMMIFAAATIYGVGKTFFWPTMLGVVAEQCPKGGAFTLNALGGIGMLAVGTLGGPYIGVLQVENENEAVANNHEVNEMIPGLIQQSGGLTVTEQRSIYEILKYNAISDSKLDEVIAEKVPADKQVEAKTLVAEVRAKSKQNALADMVYFPMVMLAGYVLLILYFASKGGYKAKDIHEADPASLSAHSTPERVAAH